MNCQRFGELSSMWLALLKSGMTASCRVVLNIQPCDFSTVNLHLPFMYCCLVKLVPVSSSHSSVCIKDAYRQTC